MYTASSLPKTLMSHSLFVLSSPTKLALSIQQLHIPFFPIHISAIILTQQTRNQVMKYCISIIFCIMIEIIKLHSLSPPMLALFSKDIKFHSPTQPSSWLIRENISATLIRRPGEGTLVGVLGPPGEAPGSSLRQNSSTGMTEEGPMCDLPNARSP